MSIIEESNKARKRGFFGIWKNKKFYIFLALVIILGAGGYYFYNKKNTPAAVSQIKEWTVKKDDIQISVETDGKVVAKDGVDLSFAVSGDSLEVADVFVKEGDKIKKGDKIASVKTETLELSVRNAYASYQSALASYNEKMEGATDDDIEKAKSDITQAELSLAQSKISLEKTKTSAAQKIKAAEDALQAAQEELDDNLSIERSQSVKDSYEDLVDAIKAINISFEDILPDSDKILGIDDSGLNDVFENNLAVKNSSALHAANNSYLSAKSAKSDLSSASLNISVDSSYLNVDSAAQKAKSALSVFEKHLNDMQGVLEASIVSPNLTQTQLDSFKSTILSNRTAINTKITSLNDSIKAVDDARENLDDFKDAYEQAAQDLQDAESDAKQDIANAETNVRSRELSVSDAKKSYQDVIAPPTASESASARSQLTSASTNLQKANYELDQATLKSPIDGEVAMLNYKKGDIIVDNTKSVASIINYNSLFIETNIEESDINKLKSGQKAYASFDSLDGLELEGEVSFISLTSESDNNGIVTYLVRVVFENTPERKVREGMTASVNFVTGGVADVLTAPVNSVRNVNGKPSVQLAGGAWTPVTTGFTDGSSVEIISGVKEGDKILYE